MKKILILGSKGMLAGYLQKILFENYDLILVDKEECNLLDFQAVEDFIKKYNPSIIINAAAYNAVDLAEREGKDLCFKINGEAVGNLAKIGQKIGAIFITFSSEYVFDGKNQNGYLESDKTSPLNNYGKSKVIGEELTQKIGGKYYIIRTSRLFGKQGESADSKVNIIDRMLQLSKEKKELQIVDGEISCPTYALDLAKQTKYIFENNLPYGIYHIVNEGACTWYELIQYVFEQQKLSTKLIPISANEYSRPAKRPMYGKLKNTKLSPLRGWHEAVKEYLVKKESE